MALDTPLSEFESHALDAAPLTDVDLARAAAAGQSQFGRGLRSGFRGSMAQANELIGTGAEAIGLSDFAESRYKDAEEYSALADAGGPTIRDYRQVKNFSDAAMYASGMVGQGLASTVPALVLGGAGALRYGLRGAAPGAFAGAFVPEAGEQAGQLRRDPDLVGMSAEDRLANSLIKGTATAALESVVPGGVVRRLASGGAKAGAKGIAGEFVEGALKEGATEGAQTLIGQGLHNVADPTQGYDQGELINSVLGGTLAGGTLQAGARGAQMLLPERRSEIDRDLLAPTPEKIRRRFREPIPLADPDGLPTDIDSASTVEEIAEQLQAHEKTAGGQLRTFMEDNKDTPGMERFADHETDPEVRKELFGEVKRRTADTRFGKEIDDFIAGIRGEPKPDDGVKRNRQRTQTDFDLIDITREEMLPEYSDGISSQRLVDVAMAMKDFTQGNMSEEKVNKVLKYFGGERAIGTITRMRKALGLETDEAPLRKAFEAREQKRGGIQQLVMDNLRSEMLPDPAVRGEAVRIVTKRLLDAVEQGVTDEQGFMEDLFTAFGPNAEAVLEGIEPLRPNVTQQAPFEAPASRGMTGLVEEEGQGEFDAADEQGDPRDAPAEVFSDDRVAVFDSLNMAKPIMEMLKREYGKRVQFRIGKTEDGKFEITALDAAGDETGFSDDEWQGIRENEHKKSGLDKGIITVNKHGAPSNAINLVKLTSEMMRRQPQGAQNQTTLKYVADMFSRGMGQLMSDPRFKGFKTDLKRKPDGTWALPKATPVAKVGDEVFTYGDVLQVNMAQTDTAKKLRQNIREAKSPAERKDYWRKLGKYFNNQQGDRAFADQLEESILEMNSAEAMQEEGLPRLEEALKEAKFENKAIGEHANKRLIGYLNKVKERIELEVDRRERNFADYGTETPETEGYIADPQALKDKELERVINREGRSERTIVGSTMKEQDPKRPRFVDETTGLPLRGQPGKDSAGALRTGISRKAKAPGKVVNVTSPKGTTKKVVSKDDEPYKGVKRSAAQKKRSTRKSMPQTKQKEIRTYVEKVLGKDAKVLFDKMEDAGTFAKLNGVETLSIAVDAMDPQSVAYHEAMHGLISRLMAANPKAAAELMNVANSPTMKARLRKLLEGETAALKQVEEDPEEALAYMYQFWAAGELRVGPNATTWFEKIAAFMRKAFRVFVELNSGNEEKVAKVFEAFHDGRFANRSTTAEVMKDILPKSVAEKMAELSGPLGKFASKLFYTADGRMRSMGNAELANVADKFFVGVGGDNKEPGFLQAKYAAQNKLHSKIAQHLEGKSAEEKRLAIDSLQAGKPEGAIAEGMRKILDEIFDYMEAKGVKNVNEDGSLKPLGKLREYFPRVYSPEAIMKDRDGFVALLVKHKVPKAEAEKIATKLARPAENTDPKEDDFHTGLTYYLPNTKKRHLDIPAEELAPYLSKDLFETMATYATRAVRRAEYAERFGNKGEAIEQALDKAKKQGLSKDDELAFRGAVQAMEGSLGHDMPPAWRKAMGAMVTYQNVRLLPLALFANMVDPIGIAVRGGGVGEAFNAFKRGMTDFFRKNPDEAEQFAVELGTVETKEAANMMSDAYGSQFMSPGQRKINNLLFKWNGMESWNRSMRIQATAAARSFIIKHAKKPNEHSERYLSELGLTKDDVKMNGKTLETNDKVAQAINRWVDGAVLRPNAAIRPIWMSDPHWMLVSHLKQFSYSFLKTILARVVHEAQNGNYHPLMALGSYVPFIIAADMMKTILTPGGGDDEAREKWGVGDYLWNGTQRAGLWGPGQYALDSYGDLGRGKLPFTSAAGPSIEQMINLGHAAASPQGDMGDWFERAIPGHQLVR